jgi:hypothetical protein
MQTGYITRNRNHNDEMKITIELLRKTMDSASKTDNQNGMIQNTILTINKYEV